ncbi:Kef-type K+ transport system membrane component KefB [Methylohalomonas lacus]|uniref:Kef-type K+ transport system membrane component KefB n=1 Tax=Methylohalomonas lacus TaxID=398773 RepID=A0AAE3HLT5_9GAMM|nr:cation:proton antiporter [Methylohalomonas lacus]MCS3903494.1 Kef-type K+ transport system membrane component KefB [Methylohalomonas lacus]
MELLQTNIFTQVAGLLLLASAIGVFGQLLRLPTILSFIIVGILAGPAGFDLVGDGTEIELLSKLGIAVLLFLVGLKLDLHLVRSIGTVSLVTGLGQVFFTAAIGYLIGIALGFDAVTSLYIAVALTFSSTIIIVKLLSDKREIDSLHGRIALGFLIVQDLVVVLAMVVLSAVGVGASGENPFYDIARILMFGALFLIGTGLFIRYVAERLMQMVARSPELLVTFAIAWAAFLAAMADGLGFSKELGGLLAGVSLASTHYRDAIATRLGSLRDFLLLFFFIALGSQLDLYLIGDELGAALIFSLFVLIGNPLIVLIIMGYMGYRKRTGFLAGLTVAQISEFSLIFIAMGLTLGHVNESAVGLVTLVGLITIALSTYMILYSQQIYGFFEGWLNVFERRSAHREEGDMAVSSDQHYDVILFGLGRYGSAMYERLHQGGLKVLGVDFDPDNVRAWKRQGIPAMYGDMADSDFVMHLPLAGVGWVIAAIPVVSAPLSHGDPRRVLVEALKHQGFAGRIAIAAQHTGDAERLRDKGADLILMPFVDAADQAADLVLGRQQRAPIPACIDEHGNDIGARPDMPA